jgi:DNA-binding HxlR family transcriptional regulator
MLRDPATTGPHTAPCPMGLALGMLAGKWKPGILTELAERKRRFGELERRLPHVSRKVLIEQLRDLERDGLLRSRVYPEVPPRVEYSLTELGVLVLPLLRALGDFGRTVLAERQAAAAASQAPVAANEPARAASGG